MSSPQPALRIDAGDYSARLIDSTIQSEVAAYRRLRYDYFVSGRRWILADPTRPSLETDRYDEQAWHLGVFHPSGGTNATASSPETLCAYLRAIPGGAACGFMLDHDFAPLLANSDETDLLRSGAVELSRLVVAQCGREATAPQNEGHREAALQMELLLKLLYHLSLQHNIQRYYAVVEERWLRTFARRFHLPFSAIGRPFRFPDGTLTVAASATRRGLEETMARCDPNKYLWYRAAG